MATIDDIFADLPGARQTPSAPRSVEDIFTDSRELRHGEGRRNAQGVLEIGAQVNSKGYPYVTAAHPEKCIGCAMCANMCPDAAIEVFR